MLQETHMSNKVQQCITAHHTHAHIEGSQAVGGRLQTSKSCQGTYHHGVSHVPQRYAPTLAVHCQLHLFQHIPKLQPWPPQKAVSYWYNAAPSPAQNFLARTPNGAELLLL
jgi:hypothetical protein